jgi:hypothetical protein
MSERKVKVGDIFVASWGWDQTNIDFYKVVRLIGKTMALLQPIGYRPVPGSEGFMCDKVQPDPDKEIGDPIRRVVEGRGDFVGARIDSVSYASPCPPDHKAYRSWYA